MTRRLNWERRTTRFAEIRLDTPLSAHEVETRKLHAGAHPSRIPGAFTARTLFAARSEARDSLQAGIGPG